MLNNSAPTSLQRQGIRVCTNNVKPTQQVSLQQGQAAAFAELFKQELLSKMKERGLAK